MTNPFDEKPTTFEEPEEDLSWLNEDLPSIGYVPKGMYLWRVENPEYTYSKTGKPMLKCELIVVSPREKDNDDSAMGTRIFKNIVLLPSEKARRYTQNDLRGLGVDLTNASLAGIKQQVPDLDGRIVCASAYDEKNDRGELVSAVGSFRPYDPERTAADEEIPF